MKIEEFNIYKQKNGSTVGNIPFFLTRIRAGFPTFFEDFIEEKVDLNKLLIKNPTSTYFMKIEKTSSATAEIPAGSLLIVDREAEPKNGKIVVASVRNELFISRLRIKKNKETHLENSNGKEVKINPDTDIWGVVTSIIKSI
ncbi:MAG: LexA family protein [Thermodesulfobacteriota bacterium]